MHLVLVHPARHSEQALKPCRSCCEMYSYARVTLHMPLALQQRLRQRFQLLLCVAVIVVAEEHISTQNDANILQIHLGSKAQGSHQICTDNPPNIKVQAHVGCTVATGSSSNPPDHETQVALTRVDRVRH